MNILKRVTSEKLGQTETSTPEWYLPHFAISKPGRTTTKTHIVLTIQIDYP